MTAFSLFSHADYQADKRELLDWWEADSTRKDVLFYTEGLEKEPVINVIKGLPLSDAIVHFGKAGIYWGK